MPASSRDSDRQVSKRRDHFSGARYGLAPFNTLVTQARENTAFGSGSGRGGKFEGFVTRMGAAAPPMTIAPRSPRSSEPTTPSFMTRTHVSLARAHPGLALPCR